MTEVLPLDVPRFETLLRQVNDDIRMGYTGLVPCRPRALDKALDKPSYDHRTPTATRIDQVDKDKLILTLRKRLASVEEHALQVVVIITIYGHVCYK